MGYIKAQPTLAVAVTPSDTAILSPGAQYPDAGPAILYIGKSGNLSVVTESGQIANFTAVPVGFFPISVTKVLATGTVGVGGADFIVALW